MVAGIGGLTLLVGRFVAAVVAAAIVAREAAAVVGVNIR
jgi:hypothetical protein